MRFDISRYSTLIGSVLISLAIVFAAYILSDAILGSYDDEEDTTTHAHLVVDHVRGHGEGHSWRRERRHGASTAAWEVSLRQIRPNAISAISESKSS